MNDTIHLLDVVAVTEDIPQKNLLRGRVRTVIETPARASMKSNSAMTM